MDTLNDLQVGKVGEHLVCADLIMKGHIAFSTEQGLSFDVMLVANNKLYKIQVKTTRQIQAIPQRKLRTDKYIFHIRRCGKGGRRSYLENEVDVFALVALDTKIIGYMKAKEAKQTMFFSPENGKQIRKCNIKKLSEYKLEECLK